MAKLTKKERDALPNSAFALPGRRFPIHDEAHARAALSGAKRALHKKHITKSEYDTVVRKAHQALAKFGKKDHAATESFSIPSSLWAQAASEQQYLWYDEYLQD